MAPQETPATDDPGLGVFDPAEDADWNEAIAPLSQSGFDAAIASVTVALLSGNDNLDNAAKNLAQQEGMALDLAQQFVREGFEMHERLVSKEVASVGVENKAEFYDWCRNSRGRALHQAVQALHSMRNIAPFRNLAIQFKNRAP